MTIRIGITGPIGCGKSTAAAWLATLGATVIDADQVARAVVEPGEPALATVLATFGDAVRAQNGSLDRTALGRVVFADPLALARLEAILHPAIHERILAAIDAATRVGAPAVAVEAIKLLESGLADLCDEVWLITCDPDAQRERLESRGLTPVEAAERIEIQAGLLDAAGRVATRVIDTSGPLVVTRAAISRAFDAAMEAARGRT